MDGSLDDSAQSFKQSAAASNEIGDIGAWATGLLLYAWVLYQRADFASAAKLAAEMVRVGENAGDPNVVSSGTQMLGLVDLAIGPLDVAAAHLMKFRELLPPKLELLGTPSERSDHTMQGSWRQPQDYAGSHVGSMRPEPAGNGREPFCTLLGYILLKAALGALHTRH